MLIQWEKPVLSERYDKLRLGTVYIKTEVFLEYPKVKSSMRIHESVKKTNTTSFNKFRSFCMLCMPNEILMKKNTWIKFIIKTTICPIQNTMRLY